mgnify:CR=1 FL=1
MTFVFMLGFAILVGWYAQAKKGRIGATWAFLALVIEVVVWLFFYLVMAIGMPGFWEADPNRLAANGLIAVLGGSGLMFLVAASLPKKERRNA